MALFSAEVSRITSARRHSFFFAANYTFVGSTTLHYLSLEVSNSAYLRRSTMSTCIGSGTLGGNKACAQGRQHCISSTQQASGLQPLPINRVQSSHLLHEPGLCCRQHWQRWFLPLRRKAFSERGNFGSGTLGGNKACAQGRQHCISSTQQASGWQPLPINRLQSSHLLHEPGLCRQQHWQ